jgi:antitoxin YefM
MRAITYTNARQNLAKTMEQVCRDHSPVIITRKASDSVVIMSLEDYNALEETAYLLRSPKNARRLMESIAQLEGQKGIERPITPSIKVHFSPAYSCMADDRLCLN